MPPKSCSARPTRSALCAFQKRRFLKNTTNFESKDVNSALNAPKAREEQRYSKPKILKEEGLLFMIFFEALRYSLFLSVQLTRRVLDWPALRSRREGALRAKSEEKSYPKHNKLFIMKVLSLFVDFNSN